MDTFKAILKRLFCTHDYVLENSSIIKSEFDIVQESEYTPKTSCSMRRKHIWDYKCTKCKKNKRLIEKTAL